MSQHPIPSTSSSNVRKDTIDAISPGDKLIIVMGTTGAGKSTFINEATGSHLGVSNGVESCTKDLVVSEPVDILGHTIRLVDTPGYDDTYMSNAEIFRRVAKFLAKVYKANKEQIIGAIYMQDINRVRDTQPSRGIGYFKDTLGEAAAKNVLILLSHWKSEGDDGFSTSLSKQQEDCYEALLDAGPTSSFCGLLQNGATIQKYKRSKENAQKVLESFVSMPSIPLLIQQETVDQEKRLKRTVAGRAANSEVKSKIMEAKEDINRYKNAIKKIPAGKQRDRKSREIENAEKSLEIHQRTRRELGKRLTDKEGQNGRFEGITRKAKDCLCITGPGSRPE